MDGWELTGCVPGGESNKKGMDSCCVNVRVKKKDFIIYRTVWVGAGAGFPLFIKVLRYDIYRGLLPNQGV